LSLNQFRHARHIGHLVNKKGAGCDHWTAAQNSSSLLASKGIIDGKQLVIKVGKAVSRITGQIKQAVAH
jgi:hypothetical protein